MAQREAIVVPEATPEQVAATNAARPATAEAAREATIKEYSQFVAAEPIFFGMALGYNPGDAIGAEVVKRLKLDEGDSPQAVKTGSAAHNRLRAAQGLPPLEG